VDSFDMQRDAGPDPSIAQIWTPRPVVDLLWRWMVRCGFQPGPGSTMLDLAAGDGRLVEPVAPYCRLLLNDIDPRLVQVLRQKFPPPQHIILQDDFRRAVRSIPLAHNAVGAPPWMQAPDGEYLPQRYIDVCAEVLVPGGLLGLVLPHWFRPRTQLVSLGEIHPPALSRAEWPFPEKPLIHVFQKPAPDPDKTKKAKRKRGVMRPPAPPGIRPPRPRS